MKISPDTLENLWVNASKRESTTAVSAAGADDEGSFDNYQNVNIGLGMGKEGEGYSSNLMSIW